MADDTRKLGVEPFFPLPQPTRGNCRGDTGEGPPKLHINKKIFIGMHILINEAYI
jgi:hypothetical protein